MPHSPAQMLAAVAKNLPKRTGRSIEEWVKLLKTSGLTDRRERIAWLKSEYGLGTVTAEVIVVSAEGGKTVYDDPDVLVDAMFAGKKAELKPIYDKVIQLAVKLGNEVEISARKTYVALRRRRVFAIVQPTTRTRVDLGLALPGVEASGRLQPVKRLGNDRITHKIELKTPREADAQVRRWLRQAFDADA